MRFPAHWRDHARTVVSLRFLLILAISIRLLLPVLAAVATGDTAVFHTNDTASYVRPAIGLISEGRFEEDGVFEIFRTPGYPILLIPGLALGQVELITITTQIVLSVLTVFLVFRLAALMFHRVQIAILAAFLFAIEPVSIVYSSKLMAETLFTTLIALFLYFVVLYWKKESLIYLAISATALAASIYVRPIAYYLPILVFAVLVI